MFLRFLLGRFQLFDLFNRYSITYCSYQEYLLFFLFIFDSMRFSPFFAILQGMLDSGILEFLRFYRQSDLDQLIYEGLSGNYRSPDPNYSIFQLLFATLLGILDLLQLTYTFLYDLYYSTSYFPSQSILASALLFLTGFSVSMTDWLSWQILILSMILLIVVLMLFSLLSAEGGPYSLSNLFRNYLSSWVMLVFFILLWVCSQFFNIPLSSESLLNICSSYSCSYAKSSEYYELLDIFPSFPYFSIFIFSPLYSLSDSEISSQNSSQKFFIRSSCCLAQAFWAYSRF